LLPKGVHQQKLKDLNSMIEKAGVKGLGLGQDLTVHLWGGESPSFEMKAEPGIKYQETDEYD